MLLINAIVGFWQEYKADNAIELLKKKLALNSRALRDGETLRMGKGFDLMGKKEIFGEIILEPYQFMWVESSY